MIPEIGRTYNLASDLALKGAENGVVQKGSALDNDMPSELFGRGDTYDLVECILYNADGKSCGYIANRCAVLLCLLDRRIHEYSTARTEIDGIVGKQSEL